MSLFRKSRRGEKFTTETGESVSAKNLARMIFISIENEPAEIWQRTSKSYHKAGLTAEQYAEIETKFLAKIKIYLEARALRILIALTQKDDGYDLLLGEFEQLLFPTTTDGYAKFERVKKAMMDLDIVDNPPLWSREWLLGIGLNELNPITLVGFYGLMGVNAHTWHGIITKARVK